LEKTRRCTTATAVERQNQRQSETLNRNHRRVTNRGGGESLQRKNSVLQDSTSKNDIGRELDRVIEELFEVESKQGRRRGRGALLSLWQDEDQKTTCPPSKDQKTCPPSDDDLEYKRTACPPSGDELEYQKTTCPPSEEELGTTCPPSDDELEDYQKTSCPPSKEELEYQKTTCLPSEDELEDIDALLGNDAEDSSCTDQDEDGSAPFYGFPTPDDASQTGLIELIKALKSEEAFDKSEALKGDNQQEGDELGHKKEKEWKPELLLTACWRKTQKA